MSCQTVLRMIQLRFVRNYLRTVYFEAHVIHLVHQNNIFEAHLDCRITGFGMVHYEIATYVTRI